MRCWGVFFILFLELGLFVGIVWFGFLGVFVASLEVSITQGIRWRGARIEVTFFSGIGFGTLG